MYTDISPDHQELIKHIKDFYRLYHQAEYSPTTKEVFEAALEALALKAQFDHPQGGEDRLNHPLAPQIKRERCAIMRLTRSLRPARGNRPIEFA